MKRKLAMIILTLTLVLCSILGLTACGHEHSYTTSVTAPTCTEQGYTTYTCSCGDTYVDDYVDALDHDFKDYIYNNDAKCEQDGTETAICDNGCGEKHTRTKEGSALEHNYTNYVYNNDAKCEVNGTETAICDNGCGTSDIRTKIGTALEHDFKDYIPDNNATYEEDGTKTATCSRLGCNEKHTITDIGTRLESGIAFKTLSVNGTDVYGKVSNTTETFSFIDEVLAVGTAKFVVSLDIYGMQPVATKTIPLTVGNNKVYVIEMIDDDPTDVYEVVVRRKPMYTVSFNTNGGTSVQSQTVEEDALATMPIAPTRLGYTFDKWNYNFNTPITSNKTITASWTANTNTPYKVEYYLQNLENDNYTKQETVNKTGTTDTIAKAEIKTFAHFTHKATSTDSGNINANGTTVLKVYYTRDKYTVTFDGNGGTLVSGNASQTVKYGGSVIAPTFEKTGYTFIGYDKTNYSNISKSFTVTAMWNIIVYTITYDLDGGCTSNPTSYTIETDTITLNNPRKTNHGFLGWYNGNKKIETIEPSTQKDYHITAKWEYALIIYSSTLQGVRTSAKTTCYEIEVPNSVTTINSRVFNGCIVLEKITLPFVGAKAGVKDSDTYQYPFGYIFGASSYTGSYSATQHYYGSSTSSTTSTTYYIPTSLKYVTITGGNILYGAFFNCSSLTSVEIGDSVTSIGYCAFYDCTKLTSIVISDSVTSIGDHAFSYCENLTSIVIPDSVTSIGEYAFSGCSSLQYNVEGNLKYLGNTTNPYIYLAETNSTSITSATINSKCRFIGRSAFYNCTSLTSVVIPDSVTIISERAFYQCESLTSVVIGNSVTSIGDYAFYQCSSLTSVVIGNSVTSIGDYAFYDCYSLTSVVIGDSVTSIGDYAFTGCSSLIKVNYLGTIDQWVQIEFSNSYSNPIYYAKNLYINDVLQTEITINAEKINHYAFSGCASLTSVTIGSGVQSIGEDAFEWCDSLTKANYTGTIDQWAQISFSGSVSNPICYAKNLYINDVLQTEITINAEKINHYAFSGCTSLTSVTIGSGVQSIGDYAFSGCTSLTSVTIGSGVQSIGDYAFSGCTSLTSVVIPDSVTSIRKGAFAGCSSITSIVIPNSVTSIGHYAFEWCDSLTSIKYCGSESQWLSITKGYAWDYNTGNYTIIYNYTGK